MTDIAQLGYDVDTSTVAAAESTLERFAGAGERADAALKKVATTARSAQASFSGLAQRVGNQARVAFDQLATSARTLTTRLTTGLSRAANTARDNFRLLGLQLSQVVQQGAVTGDFLRAFAVQAADIGLVFGTVGIAIGAAITLFGPLAAGLFESEEAARDLDSALDNLAETVDSLQQPLDILELSIDDLIQKYGDAAQQVREFAAVQAELAASQAQRRLSQSFEILADSIDQYTQRLAGRGEFNITSLRNIEADFKLTGAAALEFRDALVQLENSGSLDAQTSALEGILDLLEKNNIELSAVPEELQLAISDMISYQRETAAAVQLTKDLASAASNITIGNFGALSGLSGDELLPNLAGNGLERPERERRGRSGRSNFDPFERDLERLTQSLETERETLDRNYQQNLELLQDARAREFLTEQEHRQALLRLEREYQESVSDLGAEDRDRRIGETQSLFAGLARVTEEGGSKLAKAAAVFGGVEATVNAYRAAAQALADPSVPFFGKFAAYASVLATGLGAAKAISAAGGTGGSTSSGATGVSASTPVQETTEVFQFEVIGDGPVADLFESFLDMATNRNRRGRNIEVVRR